MGKARDISKIFSSSTSVATDSEISAFNYLTQASASSIYLEQSSASSTYLTQSSASSIYTPKTSPVVGFKNKIINGKFDIWQRGTSFTAAGYTADRWAIVAASGQTVSISRQDFIPGSAPVAGYEGIYFTRLAWSGTPSGTYWFTQRIEDVRTFAGQTITLSFWAKASSSTSLLSMVVEQNFGSGGSTGVTISGSAVNLTTSWQRFSQTFNIPSISGKTIGQSSYLDVRPFNGGSSVNGINIDIWGVQIEKGSMATELEERPYGNELRLCQRYFQVSRLEQYFPTASINQVIGSSITFATTMRSTPNATLNQVGNLNVFLGYVNQLYADMLSILMYPTTGGLRTGGFWNIVLEIEL